LGDKEPADALNLQEHDVLGTHDMSVRCLLPGLLLLCQLPLSAQNDFSFRYVYDPCAHFHGLRASAADSTDHVHFLATMPMPRANPFRDRHRPTS